MTEVGAVEAGAELDARPPARKGPWKKPRPQVGLALLLITAAFPTRFPGAGGVSFSIFDAAVATICIVQLLMMGAAVRPWPKPPAAIVVAILTPMMLGLASIFWSQSPLDTFKAVGSWVESLVVLMYVVAVFRDQYPRTIIKWFARFGLLLLIAPLMMYLHVPGFDPPAEIYRLSGDYLSFYTRFSHPFIGRSNNIATLLVILFLPLLYWSTMVRRHRIATLLIGAAMVATLSRGVLVGATICALFMVVRTRERAGRLVRRLVTFVALAILPVTAALIYDPTVADNFNNRLTSDTVDIRQQLLTDGWASIGDNPLLGIGAGVGGSIHNTYLQQIVYFGVLLGAIVVLALLRVPLWFLRRGDFVRACGMGVAAAWISLLFESSLEGQLLRPLIFLEIGMCVALVNSRQLLPPAGDRPLSSVAEERPRRGNRVREGHGLARRQPERARREARGHAADSD